MLEHLILVCMALAIVISGFVVFGLMGALGEAELRLARLERHLGIRTFFPHRPQLTDAEWNQMGVVFPDQRNYVPREQPVKKGC